MLRVKHESLCARECASRKAPGVLGALRRIDVVQIVHACWGLPHIFALVEVKNQKALSNLVLEKVQCIDGIESTDTHIVID